jgi:hypothetical protein
MAHSRNPPTCRYQRGAICCFLYTAEVFVVRRPASAGRPPAIERRGRMNKVKRLLIPAATLLAFAVGALASWRL